MAAMHMTNHTTSATPVHKGSPYCCPATSPDVPGITDLQPERLHA